MNVFGPAFSKTILVGGGGGGLKRFLLVNCAMVLLKYNVSVVSLIADVFMTARPHRHLTLLTLDVNSDIIYMNSYL